MLTRNGATGMTTPSKYEDSGGTITWRGDCWQRPATSYEKSSPMTKPQAAPRARRRPRSARHEISTRIVLHFGTHVEGVAAERNATQLSDAGAATHSLVPVREVLDSSRKPP